MEQLFFVGGDAQIKATKQVTGPLRITLAQYRNLAAFAQFASDLDKATQKQLSRGERMMRILRQGQYVPFRIGKTILIVYAGMNGYTDDVAVAKIAAYEEQLFQFIDAKYPALIDTIEKEKKLDDKLTAEVKKALEEFGKTFAA